MNSFDGNSGGHKGGRYVATAGAPADPLDALDDTPAAPPTPLAAPAVYAPPLPMFSAGAVAWTATVGMNPTAAVAPPTVAGGTATVATVQAFAAAGSPEMVAAPTVESGVFVG